MDEAPEANAILPIAVELLPEASALFPIAFADIPLPIELGPRTFEKLPEASALHPERRIEIRVSASFEITKQVRDDRLLIYY